MFSIHKRREPLAAMAVLLRLLVLSSSTISALAFVGMMQPRWCHSRHHPHNNNLRSVTSVNDDFEVGFASGQVDLPATADEDCQQQQQEKADDGGQQQQPHAPYRHERLSMDQITKRSKGFLSLMKMRRTMRFFSRDPVPKEIIETVVETASTAPSGAHKQPWSFVAVSDPETKQTIRDIVEREETLNYEKRMKESWVADVEDMVSRVHHGSSSSDNDDEDANNMIQKPYLTDAPWLIVVLKQNFGIDAVTKQRIDHYYVNESVGIACGILTAAIQNANLATLTSTPLGAEKNIRDLLGRPENEKVVLLMPVGFPAEHATVPYRKEERKPIDEVLFWK